MESPPSNGAPENRSERPELSEREREILVLVASGASNKHIAQQLVISPNTVKVHVRNIFSKIGVASRTEAALYAIREGLVATPGSLPVIAAEEEAEPSQETGGLLAAAGGPGTPGAAVGEHAPPVAQSSADKRATAPRRPWLWWAAGLLVLALAVTAVAVAYSRRQPPLTVTPTAIVPTPIPRWKSLAGLPTPRSGLAVATYQHLIYAIGGRTASGVTGVVEQFDTVTGVWSPLTAKPLAVSEVGAAVVGGRIYVPGGRLASGEISTALEVYDPGEDRWERGADLPRPASAYGLVAFEGRLYLFGGWDGEAYVATAYVYDPGTDRWDTGPPMPTARAFLGAAVAADQVFVMGGRNSQGPLSANEAFSPNQPDDAWQSRADLPQPLAGLGLTSLADVVYAFGGQAADGRLGAWSYAVAQDTWKALDTPEASATEQLGVAALQSRLYVLGGVQETALSAQNLAYQAIYTTVFPGVIGE